MEFESIINIFLSAFIVILKFVWDKVKNQVNEKMRVTVEEIAVIVEALYDGSAPADKLAAFMELCKNKGLNVKKAVEYLEKHIIPISRNINTYQKTDETKKEVTN